ATSLPCTATPARWAGAPTRSARTWSSTTAATPVRSGATPRPARRAAAAGEETYRRGRELPGYGEEKSKIFLAILGKRLGQAAPGWEEAAAPFSDATPRAAADGVSPRSPDAVP